jgi:hypothetical protein
VRAVPLRKLNKKECCSRADEVIRHFITRLGSGVAWLFAARAQ